MTDHHFVTSHEEMTECIECDNPFDSNDRKHTGFGDWDFKDFSSKMTVICPQCKTEYTEEY